MGHGKAHFQAGVRRSHGYAAWCADYAHAVACGQGLEMEGIEAVEDVLEAAGRDYACMAHCAFPYGTCACKGSGVGDSRPRAAFSQAASQKYDRFFQRYRPRCVVEGAAVLYAFNVGDDRAGFRVFAQIAEEIDRVKVRLVAAAYRLAEIDAVSGCDDGEVIGKEAALGYEADRARLHAGVHQKGQPGRGAVNAYAVRPYQACTAHPREGRHLFLDRFTFRAGLSEACRIDDYRPDAFCDAFPDCARGCRSRCDDDGHIDRVGYGKYGRVSRKAEDLTLAGVHRVPPEPGIYKRIHKEAADLGLFG